MARCRRLAGSCECLPDTLAGLYLATFAILVPRRAGEFAIIHNSLYIAFCSDQRLGGGTNYRVSAAVALIDEALAACVDIG